MPSYVKAIDFTPKEVSLVCNTHTRTQTDTHAHTEACMHTHSVIFFAPVGTDMLAYKRQINWGGAVKHNSTYSTHLLEPSLLCDKRLAMKIDAGSLQIKSYPASHSGVRFYTSNPCWGKWKKVQGSQYIFKTAWPHKSDWQQSNHHSAIFTHKTWQNYCNLLYSYFQVYF